LEEICGPRDWLRTKVWQKWFVFLKTAIAPDLAADLSSFKLLELALELSWIKDIPTWSAVS
jgi:hypothetical protein